MTASNLNPTKLPSQANTIELARQEILRRMLESGYSEDKLLLNSSFLGRNGQNYSPDIIIA
ncbi:MAG: hypothetical protein ACK50H_01595 [Dolichospermum sp.]